MSSFKQTILIELKCRFSIIGFSVIMVPEQHNDQSTSYLNQTLADVTRNGRTVKPEYSGH